MLHNILVNTSSDPIASRGSIFYIFHYLNIYVVYVCKYFNNKPYYGIVFNTIIVKNNQNKNYENLCCIIYEDNDREDMNLEEFNEFHCDSNLIPSEILKKLSIHNICNKN